MNRYGLVFLVVAPGCAGPSAMTYVPPKEDLVEIVEYLAEPSAVVWDRLVQRLSRSELVLDHLDREGKMMVVSLRTDNAEPYADCGRIAYGAGKEAPLARTMTRSGSSSTFTQSAQLVATVYVRIEDEGEGTLVSINPIYEVTVDSGIRGYGQQERWVSTPKVTNSEGVAVSGGDIKLERRTVATKAGANRFSLIFVTNTPNQVAWGPEEDPAYVSCCSTGKLEEMILELAVGSDAPG